MQSAGPIIVVAPNVKRDQGRRTQLANIEAGKTVASIVRTTLGPKSMLKLMIDPMGGIVITNDGNAILREIDVTHPAAKSVIELSRAQDEEVGDGTTSVVIVTGEILSLTEELLNQRIHPTVIVKGYNKALEDALAVLEDICVTLDLNDEDKLLEVVAASMSTKFSTSWGTAITRLALTAAQTVVHDLPNGKREVDVKRYARIEKIPGGTPNDCQVVRGIAFEKDVTHAKMRRLIKNPRVVLLDCPLEYKKGESMTNVEITKEDEFEKLLLQEEEEVRKMCEAVAEVGCDLVITEKGVSDLAAHFLIKKNISVIRRAKKTDANRLARVTGATIVNRCEELTQADVGTQCKLFKVEKIDDDYWSFLTECEDPRACTIMLRGGSKDTLNEIERNLHDALNVARNILLEGKLLPGGGATEIEVSVRLAEKAQKISGLEQWGYQAVAKALEVIPRTLAQNCGADVVRTIAQLRSAHASSRENPHSVFLGLDGLTGQVVDTQQTGIWDTFAVKSQILKTAVECSSMLMRVDDVLSGIGKKREMVPEITNYDTSPDMPAF
eukprot:Gregarina_sp_Poly_1__2932@NODE_181_length_11831_cov_65_262326_g161_i0_p2_GENE_NODE_181_length_11831_cov_65_262326_g161_i0NODE_181_length_11831_cov_65_262326_g161_i0_p2_ORF_typecomplete_len554_score100_43Cpn60_TCP1/PF00118_24/1_3e175Borrelia_P13/PF05628_12/0_065_NODE_181_length_11831_cov_65_262326_g161_i083139974